jgi:hypothetical protein
MLSIALHDEPEIIIHGIEGEDEPTLTDDELLGATFYWSLLGAPGTRRRCRCGLKKPKLGLLPEDPIRCQKLAQEHLEAGVASRCQVCSVKHLVVSEVYSEHGSYLACRLLRNSTGAISATRRRDRARAKLR